MSLQLRKSHKRGHICHHCRFHLALGVVMSPFASRIMSTICFTFHITMVTQNSMLCLACAKGHTNCQQIGQLNKLVPFLYTYSAKLDFSTVLFCLYNSEIATREAISVIIVVYTLHCNALGVFRSPFASTITATILSHYFL